MTLVATPWIQQKNLLSPTIIPLKALYLIRLSSPLDAKFFEGSEPISLFYIR